MKLKCPSCSTAIPASQINVAHLVAVCPTCDSVFRLQAPTSPTRKLKAPEGFVVEERDDFLSITFCPHMLNPPLNIGCAALASLGSIVLTGTVFVSSVRAFNTSRIDDAIAALILGVVLCLMGMFVTMSLATAVSRKTVFTMDDECLQMSTTPAFGVSLSQAKVWLEEIKRIELTSQTYGEGTGVASTESYVTLLARRHDDTVVTLILDQPYARAAYLAQELNAALSERQQTMGVQLACLETTVDTLTLQKESANADWVFVDEDNK